MNIHETEKLRTLHSVAGAPAGHRYKGPDECAPTPAANIINYAAPNLSLAHQIAARLDSARQIRTALTLYHNAMFGQDNSDHTEPLQHRPEIRIEEALKAGRGLFQLSNDLLNELQQEFNIIENILHSFGPERG